MGQPVPPRIAIRLWRVVVTERRKATATTSFGVGRRESHDASEFYARFSPPEISADDSVARRFLRGWSRSTTVTVARSPTSSRRTRWRSSSPHRRTSSAKSTNWPSPGPETRGAAPAVPTSYLDYLQMLHDVFASCVEVLEPGGRIAVNVANLGRKPYRSLSADVISILQDDLGCCCVERSSGRKPTGQRVRSPGVAIARRPTRCFAT